MCNIDMHTHCRRGGRVYISGGGGGGGGGAGVVKIVIFIHIHINVHTTKVANLLIITCCGLLRSGKAVIMSSLTLLLRFGSHYFILFHP